MMSAQQRKAPTPLDLVVLTRARLQEAVDEAVRRGRITRSDATDLVAELIARGRSQADELLSAPRGMARRVTGHQLAIAGYDDLTAAEIADRLEGLDAGQLRGVRTYERANANRKTVLAAVERRLT
jgi:polyhydroxyalkanoate synthesis regulator phasin